MVVKLSRVSATVVVALMLALITSGCDVVTTQGEREGPRSPGLAATLTRLRDPMGFFVDPIYFDSPGSAYATAILQDVLEGGAVKVDGAEANRLCASDERALVGEPWFSWSMARLMGRDAPCLSADVPQLTGEATHDIPVLYAWAYSRVTAGDATESLVDVVQPVLAASGESLPPYVMWRFDQIEDLLGLESTADSRPSLPPATVQSPSELWDWWGYLMRCRTRQPLCSDASHVSPEEAARAAVAFSDDLSLASAIVVAQDLGDRGTADALLSDVDRRRVNGDGLVRHGWFLGSIDATFHVLQLAPELFPGPEPSVLTQDLARRIQLLPTTARTQRLRAMAILKAVDQRQWEGLRAEVDREYSTLQGASVNRTTMHSHLDAVAAFSAMGLDIPIARLEIFDTDGEPAEYDALVAVAHAWAFSNDEEILRAYQELRDEALAVASQPHEPVMVYMAQLQALNGPGVVVEQERSHEIGQALKDALQGCTINGWSAESLYRFTLEPASTCSLGLTVGFIESGFGK